MRTTRIPSGLFVALFALTSCDDTTAPEPKSPPPPAALLLEAVTPVSATGISGEELDVAPIVRVMREDGHPVSGIEVSFVVGGSGFVGSATVMTDSAGLATPGTWRLGPGAGPQTLTAHAAGRSLVFTANAQPAQLEAVTPMSATGIVGEELTIAPVVRVMTSDGLPVDGIQVAFMVGGGSGAVDNVTVMTDSAGLASAGAWRLGTRAGPQTLAAHAAGRSLVFKADARPGPITTLTVIGGNHQRATGGIALSELLRVRAIDDYGNVVTDSAVTFAVADGGGSLEPSVSITGSDGIAESRWTLGTAAGRQHVRAQMGEETPAEFTAEAYCDAGQCSFELAYSMNGNILTFTGATGGTRQVMSDGLSSDPAWSPDGERIAFQRGGANGGIFVMNSDGTGVTRVTSAGAGSPTWSPRGDALAFIDCTSECGLYVQELSGGSAARQIAVLGSYPAWSPDGSRIAFFSFHGHLIPGDDTPFISLRLVNPDGSGGTEIVPVTPANMDGATWSPDGTRIAFSMNSDIYVVHANGSALTRLTTYAIAGTPAWSPDGTRIAYDHYDHSGPAPGPRIMAIPADGGEPVTLVAPGYGPSWRP